MILGPHLQFPHHENPEIAPNLNLVNKEMWKEAGLGKSIEIIWVNE